MFCQVISFWFVLSSIGLPVLANSSNDDLKVAEEFNDIQSVPFGLVIKSNSNLNGCTKETGNGSNSTSTKETVTRSTKSYHVFSDIKTDFLSAFHWCIRYNMRLATIESAGENVMFMEEFRKHNRSNDDYYWIAGRRLAISGRFNWIPSGSNINYFNFDVKEPTNTPPDFCLCVSSYGLSGRWHDTHCTGQRYFICEK